MSFRIGNILAGFDFFIQAQLEQSKIEMDALTFGSCALFKDDFYVSDDVL